MDLLGLLTAWCWALGSALIFAGGHAMGRHRGRLEGWVEALTWRRDRGC